MAPKGSQHLSPPILEDGLHLGGSKHFCRSVRSAAEKAAVTSANINILGSTQLLDRFVRNPGPPGPLTFSSALAPIVTGDRPSTGVLE